MDKKKEVLFLRPRDKSLEAYKEWISTLTRFLIGEARDTLTEEEWKTAWQEFWGVDKLEKVEK